MTTGSQQGLDLVARVLDPGDVVLVELPSYTGAITAFRNVRAQMEGIPQEGDGIDLAALDSIHGRLVDAGRRVRFLYVTPNFQNPTGLLMGLRKRQLLLEWAASQNVLILEDDPYRELYFEDSASEADVRPMKTDDGEGRVIYLSSFSKTLAPGFRVAWIDTPAPIAVKLEMAKQAGDLCGRPRSAYRPRVRTAGDSRAPAAHASTPLRREARSDGGGVSARAGHPADVAGAPRQVFCGRRSRTQSTRTSCWTGPCVTAWSMAAARFRRQARREPNQAVVLRAPHDHIREGVRRLAEAIREQLRGGAGGPVSTSFHWLVRLPVGAITTAPPERPNAGGMASGSSSVI